jgi:hypothetical protein
MDFVSARNGQHGTPTKHAWRGGLLLLVAAVSALAALVLGLALLFNPGSFKPAIQAAASEATGLDVRIAGKLALSLFPFGVSAKDVRVASKGVELGSVESLELTVAPLPLLRKKLVVRSGRLVRPAVAIERKADGHLNLEGIAKRPAEGHPMAPFRLNHLELSGGVLVYLDAKTGEKTELKGLDLTIDELMIADVSAGALLRNTSLEGRFVCREVRRGDLRLENVASPLKMERGALHLTHLSMDVFGSKGQGDATADLSDVDAAYAIRLEVSNLDFTRLGESFGGGKVVGGRGALHASLTMKEREHRSLMSSVNGTVSLSGDNLVSYTQDLDELLSSYEASQKFNLVDLGAFFIAGPVGVVALKGYGYGKVLAQARGGQGAITRFVSHWKIRDGVAEATDCALATRHHRVALKGKLDLVTERYGEGATVALLDAKGCATRKQSIGGPLGSPQVGAANVVQTLGGPAVDLYDRAKRLLEGRKCEVFYRGAVPQPPG